MDSFSTFKVLEISPVMAPYVQMAAMQSHLNETMTRNKLGLPTILNSPFNQTMTQPTLGPSHISKKSPIILLFLLVAFWILVEMVQCYLKRPVRHWNLAVNSFDHWRWLCIEEKCHPREKSNLVQQMA